MTELPQPNEIWRHYKGGLYRVICTAAMEADEEVVVVYSSEGVGRRWVRPLREWHEAIAPGIHRFTLVRARGE